PVKRIPRRSQTYLWISALLVGEIFIFYYAMRKCSWPYNPHWDTSLTDPFRIALIADPQIINSYSYGRTGILQRVSEIYPDMHMRKNWINLQNIFDPDAIIFLVDLMDGGREWVDDKLKSNVSALIEKNLFKPMQKFDLVHEKEELLKCTEDIKGNLQVEQLDEEVAHRI
ncbi:901_t:CDS:2, partial [Gigaspora margarita]